MQTEPRILVIDIETQPAIAEVWGLWDVNIGINQIIQPSSLLCFAAKWVGEKEMHFHAEWDGVGIMRDAAHALVDEADYIVGWNSRNFDMKHLRAEFLLGGYTPPSPHRDLDLMVIAKKNFRLMSNKLDFYAQQLGMGHKVQNGGFQLWKDLRYPKSDAALEKSRKLMEKYNKQDVVLTEKIFHRLRPYCGLNVPLYVDGMETSHCTRCGSDKIQKRGFAYATSYRYQRYQCQKCGGWMRAAKSEPMRTELRNV